MMASKLRSKLFPSMIGILLSPLDYFVQFVILLIIFLILIFMFLRFCDGQSITAFLIFFSVLFLYFSPVSTTAIFVYSLFRLFFFLLLQKMIVFLYFKFAVKFYYSNPLLFSTLTSLGYAAIPVVGFILGVVNSTTWRNDFFSFEHVLFITPLHSFLLIFS